MRKTRDFRTARRWREAEAMEALRAWRASGQSLEQFASETGIEEHRLRRWVRRAGASLRAPKMLPVRVVAGPGARRVVDDRVDAHRDVAAIEIVLGGGRRVIVHRGFDADDLARLLEIVERA
jgi:hypothetical protein